jgi:hypothetical protein
MGFPQSSSIGDGAVPMFIKVNGLDFPLDPITSRQTLNNRSPSFNENGAPPDLKYDILMSLDIGL